MDITQFFGGAGFDHTTVEKASANNVLPAGDYPLFSVKVETKQTKAGDGHYLEIEFDVIDGQHKDRKLWARMNIDNRSEKAVAIARAELSALCEAVGVRTLTDEAQLLHVGVIGHVKVDKSGQNVIRSYSSIGKHAVSPNAAPALAAQVPRAPQTQDAPAPQPTAATQSQPAQGVSQQPPAAQSRPWERPQQAQGMSEPRF